MTTSFTSSDGLVVAISTPQVMYKDVVKSRISPDFKEQIKSRFPEKILE